MDDKDWAEVRNRTNEKFGNILEGSTPAPVGSPWHNYIEVTEEKLAEIERQYREDWETTINLVPDLVQEIRRLRAENETQRKCLREYRHGLEYIKQVCGKAFENFFK